MASHAYCNESSDFFPVFGNQAVPIRSIVPIIPREHGAPPCYVVLVDQLSESIIEQLAEMIFQEWQPECKSIQMAREYMLQDGLPLRTTHFSSVGTNDYFQMPMGAALNAIRSGYQSQN
ncbi:hypothetical protein [uncultured Nostoc sp.]|uniref:hypothetical protein n=1 Tax=uncultured Nostoc sp. TaxID=340711 RepID=UPI0035CAD471